MQLEIHIPGTRHIWRLQKERILIGKHAQCDVVIPEEYKSVAREHVLLQFQNGSLSFRDTSGSVTTYLNGIPMKEGELLSEDWLQLGQDGPRLMMIFGDALAAPGEQGSATIIRTPAVVASSPAPQASKRLDRPAASGPNPPAEMRGRGSAPFLTSKTVDDLTVQAVRRDVSADSATRVFGGKTRQPEVAAPRETSSQRPRFGMPGESTSREPRTSSGNAHSSTSTPQSMPEAFSEEREAMIERKLDTMSKFTLVLVILVIALLGVAIYQNRQIDKNREAVEKLGRQAQGAISQFTPALDQRLSAFEKRLDGVDVKMKAAEDSMVSRMNQEVPTMLDTYLDKKMKAMDTMASKKIKGKR